MKEIRRIQAQGEPLLLQAAQNGDKDRVEELIKAGFPVDCRDKVSLTLFLHTHGERGDGGERQGHGTGEP